MSKTCVKCPKCGEVITEPPLNQAHEELLKKMEEEGVLAPVVVSSVSFGTPVFAVGPSTFESLEAKIKNLEDRIAVLEAFFAKVQVLPTGGLLLKD